MSKKLTLADINKEVKEYERKKRVELSGDFHVFIYPLFSPSKIKELLQDVLMDGVKANEAGIDFESIDTAEWGLFNIIVHFADLGIPKEIKKKVQVFLSLRDSVHFHEIINHFPEESIQKVTDALEVATQNLNKLINENNNVNLNELVDEATNEVSE